VRTGPYTAVREVIVAPGPNQEKYLFSYPPDSERDVRMGSAPVALRAGIQQAIPAVPTASDATAPNATGSALVTQYGRLSITRASPAAATSPMEALTIDIRNPCPKISRMRCFGRTPSAILIPNSGMRWLREYARSGGNRVAAVAGLSRGSGRGFQRPKAFVNNSEVVTPVSERYVDCRWLRATELRLA
jgi:hypothetical protein